MLAEAVPSTDSTGELVHENFSESLRLFWHTDNLDRNFLL